MRPRPTSGPAGHRRPALPLVDCYAVVSPAPSGTAPPSLVLGVLISYVEIAGRAGMRAEALAMAKLAKSIFDAMPKFRQGYLRKLATSLGGGGM